MYTHLPANPHRAAQVEALLQLGRGAEAGEALAAAVARSPAFAEDPDYAMLLEAVQEVQNDSYAP